MHGIGVKLKIERSVPNGEGLHRLHQRVPRGVTDVLRGPSQRGWQPMTGQIAVIIGFGPTIKVAPTKSLEQPAVFSLGSKTGRLMPLLVASDVDVKASLLRQRGRSLVATHVVLSDVGRRVAILPHRLGNRDCRRCDILMLLWPLKSCLLLRDTPPPVTIETADDINVVVNAGRVLSGQHRCPSRRAVGLGIGPRKAHTGGCQPFEIGRLIDRWCRTKRWPGGTDVVPAEIIDHEYHNIWRPFRSSSCSPTAHHGDQERSHNHPCRTTHASSLHKRIKTAPVAAGRSTPKDNARSGGIANASVHPAS